MLLILDCFVASLLAMTVTASVAKPVFIAAKPMTVIASVAKQSRKPDYTYQYKYRENIRTARDFSRVRQYRPSETTPTHTQRVDDAYNERTTIYKNNNPAARAQ